MKKVILLGLLLIMVSGPSPAQSPSIPAVPERQLLTNGDFEQGLVGWNPVWSREPGAIQATLDKSQPHGGVQALRIVHTGQKDWSLTSQLTLKVQPGEMYEFSAWVRVLGEGSVALGVITRDGAGQTLEWEYGRQSTGQVVSWYHLRSRFVIAPGTATISPRLTGTGPAEVWCDDFLLVQRGKVDLSSRQGLPSRLSIQNGVLEVSLSTANGTFTVKDQRSGKSWEQRSPLHPLFIVDAKSEGSVLDLKFRDPTTMLEVAARAELEADRPEWVVTLHATGEMNTTLDWPAPFATGGGQTLILPVNEGISYPCADKSLPEMYYHLYGGHGLCMPWYGAMEGDRGWMAINQTADDAGVGIPRIDGLLCLAPKWLPQKKVFGVDRVLRYVFLEKGGYVAMAKRYREYAKATGLFRTLQEKRQTNPNVDRLVGAVNVWCWEKDAAAWCRELQSLGIKQILWSNEQPPEQLKALNEMGVLTSRYDIYQDAMNPENFPQLKYISKVWTSDAWKNNDVMIDGDGRWVRGWEVETLDGKRIPCGALCDRQAVAYARQRIPMELTTHPYGCRFIDTTTATPWRECYDPRHPMTRTDSKGFRMDLLRYVSQDCGLVCGSETGHDAAVPFVHYFEGMLSLGPYRVPDAGRKMIEVWNEVPPAVEKFQTGYGYRIPLWELVYHDCVVAQWYWGDYNNKLPKLWDRRDLWNALYGTPPMFMFDRKIWEANKARFVQSYQTAEPVARATGYYEMLSHEWLTPDHAVQRTRFANGLEVTVNFGGDPYTLPDGTVVKAMGERILSP